VPGNLHLDKINLWQYPKVDGVARLSKLPPSLGSLGQPGALLFSLVTVEFVGKIDTANSAKCLDKEVP
jgi:hypothetical protein